MLLVASSSGAKSEFGGIEAMLAADDDCGRNQLGHCDIGNVPPLVLNLNGELPLTTTMLVPLRELVASPAPMQSA